MQILWDALWTCQLGVTEDKRHLFDYFWEALSLQLAVLPHRTLISLCLICLLFGCLIMSGWSWYWKLLEVNSYAPSFSWIKEYDVPELKIHILSSAFFNMGIFSLIDILLKFYFLSFIQVYLKYKKIAHTYCIHFDEFGHMYIPMIPSLWSRYYIYLWIPKISLHSFVCVCEEGLHEIYPLKKYTMPYCSL